MVLFTKAVHFGLAAAAVPKDLNVTENASVQGVSKTIAAGALSYYKGSASKFVDLTAPYWWWQMGALTGAMLDYSHFTRDKSYDDVLRTALLAQVGPDFNFMSPAHAGQMGNDDMGMWAFAVMSAAERNFPQPESNVPSWLKMGENIFNSMVSRWDTTSCGGGLPWQIYASNPNGLNYKNSVSNGAFFQLAARLARATGNQTYSDWATKIYDWSTKVGFIDSKFHVVDGADRRDDCKKLNPVSFTYSSGIYLYGAAVMANHTNGDKTWTDRALGFVESEKQYFGPFPNATDVLYEPACELVGTCNVDMKSHKGMLSRFMWASTLMVPALAKPVSDLLRPSGEAAAKSCTGGDKGTTCGFRWYVGGFDGDTGLGPEMCALETIQGGLVATAEPPLRGDAIKDVRKPKGGAAPAPAKDQKPAKARCVARAFAA